MLLEATDSIDPQKFKETDLYKKCLDMGIIPASEEDLEKRANQAICSDPTPALPQNDHGTPQKTQRPVKDATLKLTLLISGMWCPACSWVIEEVLKKSPGIMDPVCNFSTDRLRCEYNPILTSPTQIIHTIDRLGYKAYLPGESAQLKESRKEFVRFGISCFLTLNVMMLSFALYSGFFSELSNDAIYKISWPIFIMASCVLFYGGARIFHKALAGVTKAASSMETLISIGALSAYCYSCYSFFTGSIHQYFDTASMLITLVLLGKLLERRAKNKVQEDLEKFFLLMPRKVRLCSELYPDGRYVNIERLQTNDVFRVDESEIVPADGVILEGKGSIDESSLTGEPLPVPKKSGDRLKSGTKVTRGTFKAKTERVGDDSILGQMIGIMQRALDQKSPIEGSTDLILKWFVPAIITLAFATGLFCVLTGLSQGESMIRSITVLVIACPCALGIAIPLARVAGVSLAEKKGILVRNFSAFNQAGKVDTFIFDKTGTITRGNWALRKIVPLDRFTEDQVLSMAASLERGSEHNIAMEIKGRAERRHLELPEIQDIKSYENGVSGWIEKKEIKIGSRDFLLKEVEASLPISLQQVSQLDIAVSTVYMAFDGKLCAIFLFGDKIRQGAFPAVEKLRSFGHRLALVSGDGDATTKAVGKKLGIEISYGEKTPQDKALLVEDLQKQGSVVSMIGDGVNDAPALAQSDLSFAIHSGGNLAKEAADITLMRSNPEQILDFLLLARKVRRKISQNLVFSFLYNTTSIPVAMMGLLTPLIAVCAMLMSSLTVIGNTLLLVKYNRGSAT